RRTGQHETGQQVRLQAQADSRDGEELDSGDLFQPDAQPQLQHETGDQGRHRDEQQRRGQDRGVGGPAAAQRRPEAEQQADDRLHDQRDERQVQRDLELARQQLSDRNAGEGLAEVALEQDAADVVPVLEQQRIVEVVLLPDDGGDRRVLTLLAGQRFDGVTGKREHDGEDEQGGAQQDWYRLDQAPDDVTAHTSLPYMPEGSPWGPGVARAQATAFMAGSRGVGGAPPTPVCQRQAFSTSAHSTWLSRLIRTFFTLVEYPELFR